MCVCVGGGIWGSFLKLGGLRPTGYEPSHVQLLGETFNLASSVFGHPRVYADVRHVFNFLVSTGQLSKQL